MDAVEGELIDVAGLMEKDELSNEIPIRFTCHKRLYGSLSTREKLCIGQYYKFDIRKLSASGELSFELVGIPRTIRLEDVKADTLRNHYDVDLLTLYYRNNHNNYELKVNHISQEHQQMILAAIAYGEIEKTERREIHKICTSKLHVI